MAAKKRGKKKAPASKVRSKKAATRAAVAASPRKKAGKKKKKAAAQKAVASVAVKSAGAKKVKAVGKKARTAKKRASKRSPAPAPEKMAAPPESEPGMSPGDDADADADDGDEEPSGDDDDDEGEPLQLGDEAPRFELHDHDGRLFSSGTLAGAPYVLYFYPKDDTPGCTREACDFRDAQAEFEGLGVKVVGVSPDTPASHGKFGKKYNLNFSLLADANKEVAKAYGAWVLKKNYGREYMGVERSTFLVGADGKLKQVWRRVRVNGHVAAVKDAATAL